MRKAYVIAAKRTAIGSFGGSLQHTGAVDLAVEVVKNILSGGEIAQNDIDEVILGNVLSAGLGQNISRQVVINAGLPEQIPSFAVNKVCGSGMKSVQLAYQSILSGNSNLILAGGTENMSLAPYLIKKARFGLKMNHSKLEDSMITDGLWCAFNDYHMAITAENLAQRYKITREEQDKFAFESQQKTKIAIDNGYFTPEIVPITVKKGKEKVEFISDEHPRPTVTLEKLSTMKPVFSKTGSVTAGNASGINDGAAILAIASEDYIKKNDIEPLAEIIGSASVGISPEVMGLGPVGAINKLLTTVGKDLKSIDLFELNEAFAVRSIVVLKELKIKPELVNVNGGAIALGHPIGASGARIIVTLLHAMRRKGVNLGIASLCIGGGMGIAMLFKLPE